MHRDPQIEGLNADGNPDLNITKFGGNDAVGWLAKAYTKSQRVHFGQSSSRILNYLNCASYLHLGGDPYTVKTRIYKYLGSKFFTT